MELFKTLVDREHAVKFACRFLDQFAALIACVLSCFDRVIFKGYLPFHSEGALNAWVDCDLDTEPERDFANALRSVRSEHCLMHTVHTEGCEVCTRSKTHMGRHYRQYRDRQLQRWGDLVACDHVDCQSRLGVKDMYAPRLRLSASTTLRRISFGLIRCHRKTHQP